MTKQVAVDDARREKFTGAGALLSARRAGIGALPVARRAGVDAVLDKMWSVGVVKRGGKGAYQRRVRLNAPVTRQMTNLHALVGRQAEQRLG